MAREPFSTMSANMGVNYTKTPNICTEAAARDRAREQSRATGKSVSVHDSRGREIAHYYDGQEWGSKRSSL